MSQPTSFPTKWIVRSEDDVSLLRVQLPATKPGRNEPATPTYLRLHARRKGILGWLTPRPVLRTERVASSEVGLAVSKSLKLAIGQNPITVSAASKNAYRWYQLRRSFGSVFAAVATVIGGLLVALGALGPKSGLGQGLLIAGGGLLIAAAIGVVVSAWRATDQ